MKKIICVIMMALMLMLSGCNYNMIDTNWMFNKAYITIGDRVLEVDVKSWSDSENGDDLTIVAEDGTVYMCSVQNCVMVME